MKKLCAVLVAFASMMASLAAAEESASIKVAGMVCSFCAQGVQKRLEQTGAVKSVVVDLDNHTVRIEFLVGKTLTDTEISLALEKAGYNVMSVERTGRE